MAHDLGSTVAGGLVEASEASGEARTAAAKPTPGAADPLGLVLSATTGRLAEQAWPSRTAVEVAAALLPSVKAPGWSGPGPQARPEKGWYLEVGPGLVRIRHADRPGWEKAVDDPAPLRPPQPLDPADVDGIAALLAEHDAVIEASCKDLNDRRVVDTFLGPRTRQGEQVGGSWSARSRSRLIQRIAATDLSPLLAREGYRMAMVTLTYPGDWQAVCESPADMRRHLLAFRRRVERLLGPVPAIWKVEYQRRGAPHIHLAMGVPLGEFDWRQGRGRSAVQRRTQFRTWLSWTWADIVNAQGEERERHLRAGTAVDFQEADRYSDPKRLAVYFTRHTVKGGRSKAYQHHSPPGWENPGRWWGFWRMDSCTVEVPVDQATAVQAMRIARRMVERRSVPKSIPVVDQATGQVVRWRHVRRRFRVRALHQKDGASIVMNDGPQFVTAVALHLGARPPTNGRRATPLP